ncbi:MAG: dCMP deaminase family protein [Candidatus Marinimicrobia bacterium]|nr:dCMP deaminase family protein [Candidatus Neomarinimicrobiota bacterium]MCF7880289.1 dCMP deaminase family protein [Candidatus Neomarinimicrobiota bacterium]
MARKSWDEYFIDILHSARERATCDRGRSAALLVKNNHILSTGYVGSPAGIDHCSEVGHEFIDSYEKNDAGEIELRQHCVRTVHAEQNAISQAAKFGIAVEGATLYCTMFPCYTCAKMLVNVGINRIIAEFDYQSSEKSKILFNQLQIPYFVLNEGDQLEYS